MAAESPSGPGDDYFNRLKRRPDVLRVPACLSTLPGDNGACSLRNNGQLAALNFLGSSYYQSLWYNFNWKDPLCYARGGRCGSVAGGITDGARLTYWPDSRPTCTAGQTPAANNCIKPPAGASVPDDSGAFAPWCYATPIADAPPHCHDGFQSNTARAMGTSGSNGQRTRFDIPDVSSGSLLLTGDFRFSCSWMTPSAKTGTQILAAIGRISIKFLAYTGEPGGASLYDQDILLDSANSWPAPLDRSKYIFRAGPDHYSDNPFNDPNPEPGYSVHQEMGFGPNVFDIPCDKWVRFWHWLEIGTGNFHEAFTAERKFPAGRYTKHRLYMADEDRNPVNVVNWGTATTTFTHYHLMTDSSNVQMQWTNGDLHTDFRNFVWIRNPPANWTQAASGIGLERPKR
jgi:hypothetical protein